MPAGHLRSLLHDINTQRDHSWAWITSPYVLPSIDGMFGTDGRTRTPVILLRRPQKRGGGLMVPTRSAQRRFTGETRPCEETNRSEDGRTWSPRTTCRNKVKPGTHKTGRRRAPLDFGGKSGIGRLALIVIIQGVNRALQCYAL